jgi:hypothetical protein
MRTLIFLIIPENSDFFSNIRSIPQDLRTSISRAASHDYCRAGFFPAGCIGAVLEVKKNSGGGRRSFYQGVEPDGQMM